ncbi:hypothetical protein ACROYT_G004944 [Oculina patagonica]
MRRHMTLQLTQNYVICRVSDGFSTKCKIISQFLKRTKTVERGSIHPGHDLLEAAELIENTKENYLHNNDHEIQVEDESVDQHASLSEDSDREDVDVAPSRGQGRGRGSSPLGLAGGARGGTKGARGVAFGARGAVSGARSSRSARRAHATGPFQQAALELAQWPLVNTVPNVPSFTSFQK